MDIYKTLSGEKIEAVKGIRTAKFLTILEGLLWGIEVNLDGYRMRLAETIHDGFRLIYFVTNQDGEEFVCGMEMSLCSFTAMCNKIPDEEFEKFKFKLSSSKALTGIYAKKRERINE